MQGFIDFLVERRIVLALLTVALGAWVGYGITLTEMDPRSDAILPDDDPYVEQGDEVAEDFPGSSSAIFTFIGPEGDIFNRATLGAMEALHDRFGEVQSAVSVGSIVNHRLNAVDDPEVCGGEQADVLAVLPIDFLDVAGAHDLDPGLAFRIRRSLS